MAYTFTFFDGSLVFFDLDPPLSSLSLSLLSLRYLEICLRNVADVSTPVSTTKPTSVVLRDLFFREWMDEIDGGGGEVGGQSERR